MKITVSTTGEGGLYGSQLLQLKRSKTMMIFLSSCRRQSRTAWNDSLFLNFEHSNCFKVVISKAVFFCRKSNLRRRNECFFAQKLLALVHAPGSRVRKYFLFAVTCAHFHLACISIFEYMSSSCGLKYFSTVFRFNCPAELRSPFW